MVNIFIANLDWGITSEDLMSTFSSFGTVRYAHVVYEPKTKRSKGYGYVEMESTDEAINAIQALNGLEVNGRAIDVKIASPKGNRPPKKKTERPAPQGGKKPFSGGSRGFGGQSRGSGGQSRGPGGNNRGQGGSGGQNKPYYKKNENQ
jgi:RNA recognition motif-containing protein